ncbi:signal recognition particle subunit FFH/SRP54 (srp54) [Archaeoglobus sulfaticallidus PM70-1]|uniref:Signal recognition particle 54 kDa protein n=1 Tax=Archaeoglobus sulfaticallidus PM70-1 TaxID=387631 RepID=N0BKN6_9EURY|nr:signal recognition particle protein Srp54 [Archaeoglobus sulfaticallidus]AGK61071.1 signal recognition particle subunit FFH/SRP54 (srp54) [Archaeoglobus sulfaticallidus PM70-1]
MALEALKDVVRKIKSSSSIDKYLVEEIVRDIQRALLRADVNVRHVKQISDAIKKRALSEDVLPTFNVREHIIKIVYEELMRGIGEGLDIPLKKAKIMLVGLQGSGKTTTTAKMAKYFKDKGLKAGVITADTWRPAAYDQLKQLAEAYDIGFYGDKNEKDAVKIVRDGLEKMKDYDIIIIDTAGRHALEEGLINEMIEISRVANPDYKLLVLDAAIGQLASTQAKRFHDAIGIDGIVITKFDGTAKGGGALSAAREIGIPIAFLGTGEKVEDFEKFDPAGFVSRLLGMGDIKALLEKVERVVQQEDLDPEAFLKGNFTLKDVYKQIEAMRKMGPVSKIIEMLPLGGLGLKIDDDMMEATQEKMQKFKYIMDSMTEEEITNPAIIDSSRIRRIAIGSGTSPQDVKELLKYYKTMKSVMKKMKKGKFGKLPIKGFPKIF